MVETKKLYAGLGIFVLIIIAGIIFVNFGPSLPESNTYHAPGPEQVVQQYFESWNARNWPDMYATISDGFKKIDPHAKDLATFKKYAESQGVAGVKIIELKTTAYTMNGMPAATSIAGMAGMQATVVYTVEFTLSDRSKKQFSDSFTLKYREGDVIAGWKLVHPYGTNIDIS